VKIWPHRFLEIQKQKIKIVLGNKYLVSPRLRVIERYWIDLITKCKSLIVDTHNRAAGSSRPPATLLCGFDLYTEILFK
jgi:hypothetical protein